MRIFELLVLLVYVNAGSKRELPYYFKAYLYNTDKQNYENVVQKVEGVLGAVIKGEPVHKAKLKLSRYFRNCDTMIENWLWSWDHLLACDVEYDPCTTQVPTSELMNKHYHLILNSIQNSKKGDSFLDKWTLRHFWMQEFVDAQHAIMLMQAGKDTLKKGMFLFKLIIRSAKDWLTDYERSAQKDSHHRLIRPPQEPRLNFSHYGYWTFQEFRQMSSPPVEQVPFDLLLKNAQYYRALNMLDVQLYSYEDMDSHVQFSKMLYSSLSHKKHLRFLVQRMKLWSKQVQEKWKREKRIQLGDDYEMVEVMWTPWYGLALPTVYALESINGISGEFLIDFLNFGLKGITLAITTVGYKEGLTTWDVYLSSLDFIFQSIHPDLVPVFKRIHQQYRKFLELWSQPKFRAHMIKLQGLRPQDLASYSLESSEWKEVVLMEMEELGGKLHYKIADFVDSL